MRAGCRSGDVMVFVVYWILYRHGSVLWFELPLVRFGDFTVYGVYLGLYSPGCVLWIELTRECFGDFTVYGVYLGLYYPGSVLGIELHRIWVFYGIWSIFGIVFPREFIGD
mgnify:CR=1 FL=1